MTTKYFDFIKDTFKKVTDPSYSPEYSAGLLDLYYSKKKFHEDYLHDSPKESGKYFHFLKEAVKHSDVNIVFELGNREGMSTIAIWDSLRSNQELYTFDTVIDLRFVPEHVRDSSVFNFVHKDCLDEGKIIEILGERKIDILFSDTIHTFDQIQKEWNLYKNYLSDESMIFIDDIGLKDKNLITKEICESSDFDVDFFDSGKVLHSSGFGVYSLARKKY